MKIVFSGFDSSISISPCHVSVLRVENKALFTRVCQSLLSGKGEEALEPYSIWRDDGKRLSARDALIVVPSPLNLPLAHKGLLGRLHAKLCEEVQLDEALHGTLQDLNAGLRSCVASVSHQLNADYYFKVEWNLASYLKTFGFGVEVAEDASLLDNLISFIDLAADMNIDEAILFINLKTFLDKNTLEMLEERIVFHSLKVLMLENQASEYYADIESKTIVDQHFLEYQIVGRSESLSSLQGRVCSNGFGAVAF